MGVKLISYYYGKRNLSLTDCYVMGYTLIEVPLFNSNILAVDLLYERQVIRKYEK